MSISNKDSKKFDAIVCLSAIDWDFLWQRTQEVMSQFAAMGYPVLFVENTGVRVPGLKDLPRVLKRVKRLLIPEPNQSQQASVNGVRVLSPLSLPFPYSPLAVKWNSLNIRQEILRFSEKHSIPLKRILLWSYMTTPLAVELAEKIQWAGIVVDLVSDPCKVKGAEKIIESHKKMLGLADIVLCASVPMMNTARQQVDKNQYAKMKLFEDGFSTRLLDMVQNEIKGLALPVEVASRPMVAYIGGVNDKIWWDAVSAMAEAMPEVNFVFVGPKEYDSLPCEGYGKNVFWLPQFKEYSQLGYFLRNCRAGLIPYIPTPYVAEMRPAKINEYMVMGLPIVSTKLPEIDRFSKEYGTKIIYQANNPAEFADRLIQAINEDCEVYKKKRSEIAYCRSWEKVCAEIEDELNAFLKVETKRD